MILLSFAMKKKYFNIVLMLVCFFTLGACGDKGTEGKIVDQKNIESKIVLFPNAGEVRDSVDYNIAYNFVGTYLSPLGEYKLTAVIDESFELPKLSIHHSVCDGIYDGKIIDSLLTYEFTCKSDAVGTAALSLINADDSPYGKSVSQVRLEGTGSGSECISLNLVIVGEYAGTSDSVSADSLMNVIKRDVQKHYEICVDSLYVSYAAMHPLFENRIASDEPYIASFSEDFSGLARWSGERVSKALDIVLVDQIESGFSGYSPRYGEDTEKNVMVVAVRRRSGMLRSSAFVSWTALHELGHFFGLMHTSLTEFDFSNIYDHSVLEDGIEDTDICSGLVDNNRILQKANRSTAAYEQECMEQYNVMFPDITVDSKNRVSWVQRSIVQKNLTLIPH